MNIQLSDEQLMRRLVQGEQAAAGILYDRYYKKLYGYFVRMTRNTEASRDLTQNVFLKVIKYAHTWNEDRIFAYWLFRIARNLMVDFHRESRHFYEFDVAPEVAQRDRDDSVRQNDARESLDLLLDAMAKLPPGYRELIEMNRFQGFSYREIALTTDSNENAVRVKTFRAIQKLKELYEQILLD